MRKPLYTLPGLPLGPRCPCTAGPGLQANPQKVKKSAPGPAAPPASEELGTWVQQGGRNGAEAPAGGRKLPRGAQLLCDGPTCWSEAEAHALTRLGLHREMLNRPDPGATQVGEEAPPRGLQGGQYSNRWVGQNDLRGAQLLAQWAHPGRSSWASNVGAGLHDKSQQRPGLAAPQVSGEAQHVGGGRAGVMSVPAGWA